MDLLKLAHALLELIFVNPRLRRSSSDIAALNSGASVSKTGVILRTSLKKQHKSGANAHHYVFIDKMCFLHVSRIVSIV